MKLYLLRHADAQMHLNDAERPLSSKGWEQVDALCKSLQKDALGDLSVIYHSPLARARETAEGFKNGMRLKVPVKILEALTPSGDIVHTAVFLSKQNANTMAVGHNPHLEELIAYLIASNGNGCCSVTMKKCSLACLERFAEPSKEHPAGLWTLLWLLAPKVVE